MDVLGLLVPPVDTLGVLGPVPTRKTLYLQSTTEPPPTPKATIDRAKYVKTNAADAIKKQLSAGWRAFERTVPSSADAIKILTGAANEQAKAAMLKLFDETFAKLVPTIGELEKKFGAKERAAGVAALDEMKRALVDRQGQIDPTSTTAFAFLESIFTGAPISDGLNKAQSGAATLLHGALNASGRLAPLLKKAADAYDGLHGVAKSVATVLLASVAGVAGVAAGVKPNKDKDGYTFVAPMPLVVQFAPWLPTAGLDSLTVQKGELVQLAANLSQTLGETGLSWTGSAQFKKDNPVFVTGGLSYSAVVHDVKLTASGTASASAPGTKGFASTQKGEVAKDDLTFATRVEAKKTFGKKKNFDATAWAEAQKELKGKTEGAVGVRFTQTFGGAAERQARRAARLTRRDARKRYRANPVVVQKLTGPLPNLRRMFPSTSKTPQPYLDLPKAFPWALTLGAVGVSLGAWVYRNELRRLWT